MGHSRRLVVSAALAISLVSISRPILTASASPAFAAGRVYHLRVSKELSISTSQFRLVHGNTRASPGAAVFVLDATHHTLALGMFYAPGIGLVLSTAERVTLKSRVDYVLVLASLQPSTVVLSAPISSARGTSAMRTFAAEVPLNGITESHAAIRLPDWGARWTIAGYVQTRSAVSSDSLCLQATSSPCPSFNNYVTPAQTGWDAQMIVAHDDAGAPAPVYAVHDQVSTGASQVLAFALNA